MVIASVEIQISLIGQIRNVDRISPRLIGIGGVGVEGGADLPAQNVFRVGEGALHLIIDDAVDRDLAVRALGLVMPALLAENILLSIYIGIKDSVHVDVHQVLEVLLVAACDRINCLVRISHRVQEGVERSLGQFDKGIFDGKLL